MNIAGREQPRVALLYCVPLLCEAVAAALDSIAEVQAFPARRGDTEGLLRSLRPDAVIVDSAEEADEARRWAKLYDLPLIHVSLRERKIRVLRDGAWDETTGTTTEAIRNVLAGSIYGRRRDAT